MKKALFFFFSFFFLSALPAFADCGATLSPLTTTNNSVSATITFTEPVFTTSGGSFIADTNSTTGYSNYSSDLENGCADNAGQGFLCFTNTHNPGNTYHLYWTQDTSNLPVNLGFQEEDSTGDICRQNFSITAPTPYTLSGTVYNDGNKNGTQDSGESGYNGATVSLNTGQTATTDANGNYTFSSLQAGTYTETLTVPNGYSATTTNPATVTVSTNTTQNFGIYSPPVVSAITAPTSPTQVNTSVSTSATFTDGDTTDTHTASWDWGDNSTSAGSVTEPNGSTPGSVTGSHTYTAAGVYTVILTVTDNDGASGTSTFQYVSVYNPTSQGLFSAGQHFTSPAGAYTANTSLTGTVKFGLSYKYQGTMPTSDRQFTMNFNAANLTFNATTISSLVVANNMATLTGTGTGTINGVSATYNFLVTGVNGGGIRVQITDPSNNNNVIYDTQPGAAITATPTTSVTGNVIVHN